MADKLLPKKRKLPIKKSIFGTAIGLILLDYGLLCIQPDTETSIAAKRAFIGMATGIFGAMLWRGAIFFQQEAL